MVAQEIPVITIGTSFLIDRVHITCWPFFLSLRNAFMGQQYVHDQEKNVNDREDRIRHY